ncbi:MAG: hypothetical protein LBG90_08595 [Spirochaetaceae bacterium]|jgi:hypothetical protein|nr:hypothetical protein [Spirochaetaceae bacterium]
MLNQKEVLFILESAGKTDAKRELFGAENHRYILNPLIEEERKKRAF